MYAVYSGSVQLKEGCESRETTGKLENILWAPIICIKWFWRMRATEKSNYSLSSEDTKFR